MIREIFVLVSFSLKKNSSSSLASRSLGLTLSHRKPLARWKKSKRDAEKSTFSSEKKSKTSDGYEQTWVEEKVDKELTRAGRARATRTAKTRTDLLLNRLCFSCARKRASRSAHARLCIKERTFLSFGCCF